MLGGNWTLCSVARVPSVFHLCPASCVGFQCPVINSGPRSQAGAGSGRIRAWILLSGQGCVQMCNVCQASMCASTCVYGLHTHVRDRPEHQEEFRQSLV